MVQGVSEDPAFRALVGAVAWLILIGTVFYSLSQDWSLVDSFYFTVMTLTTVGYGDLAPTGNGAKLATVAMQLSGIGLFVLLLSEVARRSLVGHEAEPTGSSGGPASAG
jgi:hypothetical protein